MAMGGQLLELKHLGRLGLSSRSLGLARLPRLEKRRSCAKKNSCSIALGGERLRHGFVSVATNSNSWGGFYSGLGGRAVFVVAAAAAASEGEGREAEGVADKVAEELDLVEDSTFLARSKELTSVNRRAPPNLFFLVAGFCVIVLMRGVIQRELAGWGMTFGRLGSLAGEGIAVGLGKLANLLAEPIAFVIDIISWVIMAINDIYTLIVEGAPIGPLCKSLLLSLAVLSIGDATASKIRGSRTRLVGLATVIGLFGALEFIPPEAVVWSLILLTAFAKFIQKADPVTTFMPATVTFVAISEPVLRAAAFGLFLAVSMYTNLRAAQQSAQAEPTEHTPSELRETEASAGKRPSFVFSAITASICISLSSRLLYSRSVKWLFLRTVMGSKTG